MKKGWERKKLGNVIQLEYGKPLDDKKRNPYGKYPIYGANGIKGRTDEYHFDKKTIIVGRKGSAGEINLSEGKFWPLDVTYYVTFDTELYDLNFLFYLLGLLELPKLATGVKPGINRNEVYAIESYFPTLSEQQRIVAILNEALAAIAKAKVNAEQNLKNSRELFESYLQDVFEKPQSDWIICNLEDNIKLIDYRGRTPVKTSQGVKLITAKNVKLGYLQNDPQEFINTNEYSSWMSRGIPNYGDVIFTTEAPLANVAQINTTDKLAFAQRIIVMQPRYDKIDQTFLKYLLLSNPIRNKILSKATGATVSGIKSSLLKKIQIYFPQSIEKQQFIVQKLDALSTQTKKLVAIYQQKIADLDELKKSILQKAFNGELKTTEVVEA